MKRIFDFSNSDSISQYSPTNAHHNYVTTEETIETYDTKDSITDQPKTCNFYDINLPQQLCSVKPTQEKNIIDDTSEPLPISRNKLKNLTGFEGSQF